MRSCLLLLSFTLLSCENKEYSDSYGPSLDEMSETEDDRPSENDDTSDSSNSGSSDNSEESNNSNDSKASASSAMWFRLKGR